MLLAKLHHLLGMDYMVKGEASEAGRLIVWSRRKQIWFFAEIDLRLEYFQYQGSL